MTVDALIDLRTKIAQELTLRSGELKKQMERIGSYVPQSVRSGSHKTSSMKGKPVAIKYKDSKGNTWAGRGVHPVWLREALKQGKRLEDFAVGAAKAAAAASKSAKKTSRGRKAKKTKS
jgi:DNA-binding protein H-NS